MAFDVQSALKSGYTPGEIAEFLGSQLSFDVAGARQAGYSDEEIVQALSPRAGKAPGLIDRAAQGLKDTVGNVEIAATNDPRKIAGVVAEGERSRPAPSPAQVRMAEDIKPYAQAYEESSGLDAVGAFAKLAAKRLSQFVSEPGEMVGSVVQNLPNSAPGLAGSIAGAKVGSMAGPVGTVVGGIAGGTAGGYAIEQGAAMREQILKEAQARGIDPRDSAAVEPLIREKYDEFLRTSRLKGVGTAGTDAVLNAVTFGVAGAGERSIMRGASKIDDALRAGTMTARDAAAEVAKLEARQAARMTVPARLARGTGITAAEMGGESLSEAAGQQLAYGKIDPVEVIDEGLLAVGQGAGMAAGRGIVSTALGLDTRSDIDRALGGLNSRVRQANAEAALQAAPDAASAAAAANELAGSVNDLAGAVDQYLGRSPTAGAINPEIEQRFGLDALRSVPAAAAAPIAADTPVSGDPLTATAARVEAGAPLPDPAPAATEPRQPRTIAELRAMVDRDAQLLGQADAAGTGFERRMALEQAQVARGEPAPAAPRYADLTPMTEMQANQRLAVMRDMAANEGGDAFSLAVVPHPGRAGMFAIGSSSQVLPSLDLQPAPPAPVTQGEANSRLEAAAQEGQRTVRNELFRPYEAVTDRLQRGVEAAGGVATAPVAQTLDSASVGVPGQRPVVPGMRVYDSVSGETATSPIEVPVTPTVQNADQKLAAANQATNDASMLEQSKRNEANRKQADRELQGQIAASSQPTAAPDANAVIAALKTPATQRSATEVATVRQAQSRYSASDFSLLSRAAQGAFQLNVPERMRLQTLRAAPAPAAAPAAAPTGDTALVGTRVQARLGEPSDGKLIITNAKLSTQRAPAPGSTVTINDQGQEHAIRVVDPGKLGMAGRLLREIARIFGKRLVVFESDTARVDGFVMDGDNRTIYINANSQISPLAVFGHELTHLVKRDNPRAYAAIQAVVERELGEGAMEKFTEEYGAGANLEELTSDLVGNRFQEADFWRDVFLEIAAQQAEGARGVIARLANTMNRVINAFLKVVRQPGFQADQYVRDLNAIKSAIKTAMVEYVQGQREEAIALDQEGTAADAEAAPTTGDITVSPVRKAAPDETEISTQNPQGKGRLYDPLEDMLSIDEAAVREAMALPTKSGKVPLEERTVDAILSYGFVPTDTPRDKAIEVFKQNLVSNLLYLYNQVPKAIRERSKLWYDGANRIAREMGEAYGVRMEQVAGIMAAMSPQKDWFQNVSMAERALDVLTKHGDKAWDDGMLAYAKSYVQETNDRKEREKRQKAYDRAVQVAAAGTTLNDMSVNDAAVFIRAYDEAYHSRQYRIVTPEGGFGDLVRNEDGAPSTMMWSTYDPIAKSVSIFRDGSRRNISEQLGQEHKIRSFYNNIAAPNSPISHVTIDTHAVAAGLFEALAGTDTEVTDNFGGTGGSSLIGVGGTYGIIADAYRTAAKMMGVQAREMQSITWEAVRGLFGDNIKSSIKPKVKEVWQQFKDGKLSFAAARRAIVRIAERYNGVKGGVRDPDWVGTGAGDFVADGGSSYDKNYTPPGGVRLREAKELRERVTINLSAATSSIPGLKELYSRAMRGETEAAALLQRVAESSLRFLLGGTKARLTVQDSTGVYMSDREPSISIQVAFNESESAPVLAALARFAESYNQQQIHVRMPTVQPLGHEFGDGSYATVVYEIPLNRALSNDDISAIIEDSGLKGFTVTAETLTAYWVQPNEKGEHVEDFATFRTRVTRVQALAGQPGGRAKQRTERLFVYGEGDGARVPYSAIRGDVRTKTEADLQTPRLIAEYLNRGPVKAFPQKPLTAAQTKEQRQLANVFEKLPTSDLGRPIVRRAYEALAQALKDQFSVLPIKVEVMATVEIDGQPYAYWGPKAQVLVGKLVDDGLTADQARRAVQYLQRNYGAPSKSWRTGPLAAIKAMDGEPYANSAEMRRDVSVNNRFRVYKTSPASFGPPGSDFSDHPLLQDSGLKDVNGYPMLYNDVLRAVHDYFAHNISATQFGPTGEAAAWRNHMASTPDPLARWALTAETRLQNAWQNFRPGVEKLSLIERGFADQKAALPPVEFTLTGDAAVDAPMQAFIDSLSDEEKQGSLPGTAPAATPSRQRNLEDLPRDDLAGRSVRIDVRIEDTGETATMTLDAKDALDDVDERESVMQRLLECLA